jgi:spore coat protein CotF
MYQKIMGAVAARTVSTFIAPQTNTIIHVIVTTNISQKMAYVLKTIAQDAKMASPVSTSPLVNALLVKQ